MRRRAALWLALVALAVGAPSGAATTTWLGRYTVRPGDTLSAIAGRYDVSLQRLAQANGLDWRQPLPTGVILHVPGQGAGPEWSGRYTVRPGDTLSAIAGRFDVSLQTLAGANRIDMSTPLPSGRVLLVPPAHVTGEPSWPGRYRVRLGDALGAIAARFGVSLQTLAAVNGLDAAVPLPVGTLLRVPRGLVRPSRPSALLPRWTGRYEVMSGDTLTVLAGRFAVPLPTLAAVNGLDPAKALPIGLVLRVPRARTVPVQHVRLPHWAGRYTVGSGDSLSGIAQRFGVSLELLAAVNGLDAAVPLPVGTLLRVPRGLVRPSRPSALLPRWTGRYEVMSGDTLTVLAGRFAVPLPTLAAVNGLDPAKALPIGLVLRVPRARTVPVQHVRLPHWAGRYTVGSGDSLSGIAQRFGVSLELLAAVNGLDAASELRLGAILRVPRVRSVTAPPFHAPHWAGRYIVRAGDTLSAIAVRFDVALPELAAANALDDSTPLRIGVLLRVPRRPTVPLSNASLAPAASRWSGLYVVAPGDSLGEIALRFRVPLQQLMTVNRINPDELLLVGTHLRVPTAVSAALDLSDVVERDVYPSGSIGYDVSYPNCATNEQVPGAFVVVGLNKGRPFTSNPCFTRQWSAAVAPRGVYINSAYGPPLFRQISASCRARGELQPAAPGRQRAYAIGCSEAQAALAQLAPVRPSAIWVDVEPANTWSSRRDLNAATIEGMLEELLLNDPAGAVGVYSNASFWRRIVGSQLPVSVPEWVATGAVQPAGCAPAFAGGPVWLTQGVGSLLDTDLSC